MAYTKDIVEAVAEKTGATKVLTEEMLEAILTELKETLASGESVQLTGFGSFGVRTRAGKTARNLRTGEPLPIPPAKVVTFKPGKFLKQAVGTPYSR